MDNIPTDILLIIFKELGPSDAHNVALTCSRFASVIRKYLTRRLYFDQARRRFPRIAFITLRYFSTSNIIKVLITKNSMSLADLTGIIRDKNGQSLFYFKSDDKFELSTTWTAMSHAERMNLQYNDVVRDMIRYARETEM